MPNRGTQCNGLAAGLRPLHTQWRPRGRTAIREMAEKTTAVAGSVPRPRWRAMLRPAPLHPRRLDLDLHGPHRRAPDVADAVLVRAAPDRFPRVQLQDVHRAVGRRGLERPALDHVQDV